MADAVKRSILMRSPRYRHAREDDNLVRVRAEAVAVPFEARYRDLSETGVLFRARRPQELREGDSIEVMIPVPGSGREISGRARVVRAIDDQTFAARFDFLSEDSRDLLRRSLADALGRARLAGIRGVLARAYDLLAERWKTIVAIIAVAALAWAAMAWLTAPRGNYDPKTTIPWASRTFF